MTNDHPAVDDNATTADDDEDDAADDDDDADADDNPTAADDDDDGINKLESYIFSGLWNLVTHQLSGLLCLASNRVS